MTSNRVLITGASGFLGLATRRALAAAGLEAVATDAKTGENLVALDVTDSPQVDDFIADQVRHGGLDAVIHLAAAGFKNQGLVAGADAETARAVHVNVEGFVHVIEAAARHRLSRVVWSSSTTIYGPAAAYDPEPVTEGAPLRPQTAYGVTKTACEHLGPILASRWNIDVTSLRLPMVYGPGRWYGGSQQALVDLVRDLQTSTPGRVSAWTGDADWIHVADAAAALTNLAAVRTARDRAGQANAYHVLGHRGSYAALAQALIEHTGRAGSIEVETTPDGSPDIPAIDDQALRRDTGFTPRFATAAEGAATYFGDFSETRHAQPTPTLRSNS